MHQSRRIPKNFILKGDKAYTMDDVLIYTVFLCNCGELDEKELRQYFSQFGAIREIRQFLDKTRKQRAFVHFEEASSATKVLLQTYHCPKDQCIIVRAANSWVQPHGAQPCDPTEDAVADTTESSLLYSAFDHVLERIFHLLDLADQISLARTCQRFNNVFQTYCKFNYKIFNTELLRDLTKYEIRYFFRFGSEYFESISGDISFDEDLIIWLIRNYCAHLKSLRLTRLTKFHDDLRFTNLTELSLRHSNLNDDFMRPLVEIPSLETISLFKCERITGEYLGKRRQLNSLSLCGCTQIQSEALVNAFKSLVGLKSLDLRCCGGLSSVVFQTIADFCKELQILKLENYNSYDCEHLYRLPHLKHLEFWQCFNFHNELPRVYTSCKQILRDLISHKRSNQLECLKLLGSNIDMDLIRLIPEFKRLKTLTVCTVNDEALTEFCKLSELEEISLFKCSELTNESILALLENCAELRMLNLYGCFQIQQDFITKAIKVLEERSSTKGTVTFIVSGTSIYKRRLSRVPEYCEATKEKLLKVVFDNVKEENFEDSNYSKFSLISF